MFIFFIELQHSRTSDTKNLFIHISTEEDVRTLSLITINEQIYGSRQYMLHVPKWSYYFI